MAVYERDSRFWWMLLEGANLRLSTGIPIGRGAARRTSRAEADEIYRAAMGDLARGVFKLPGAKSARTFRAHAAWYQEHVTDHQRGKVRARSMIRVLVAAFGDVLLADLTTAMIEAWKVARAQVVKHATVNRELELLKPLLRSAIPACFDTNPADGVKKYRLRRVPIAILTPEAEAKLLKVASPAERAFVLLGLDALLRSGDARRLRVEHDRGAHLVLVDSKVDTYKVPVSSRLRAALDALRPVEGFYFPRRYGEKWAAMNPNTAFHLFRGVCARAKIPTGRAGGITYHALRHTGATRAASVVKLSVVRELGGWKSMRQLDRYDHPDSQDMIRAVEAIGARQAHARPRRTRKAQQKRKVS